MLGLMAWMYPAGLPLLPWMGNPGETRQTASDDHVIPDLGSITDT